MRGLWLRRNIYKQLLDVCDFPYLVKAPTILGLSNRSQEVQSLSSLIDWSVVSVGSNFGRGYTCVQNILEILEHILRNLVRAHLLSRSDDAMSFEMFHRLLIQWSSLWKVFLQSVLQVNSGITVMSV